MATVAAVRSAEPEKVRPHGLLEPYSTVVVRSRHPGELLAFTAAIGSYKEEAFAGGVNGRLDTNLRVREQFLVDGFTTVGIEWTIPAIVGPEHLDPAIHEPYHTRLLDVAEFARCAFVQVYLGGDMPYAEWVVGQKPITQGCEGARQQVRFQDGVRLDQLQRFRVIVSFPGSPPVFGALGHTPAEEALNTLGGTGLEAALPVTFRFLEAADAPPALTIRPVADALLQAASVQHQAQELLGRLEKLLNPDPDGDKVVADEIRELRKCFGSTAEMLDTLRAVRQGIRTR